MQKLFVSCILLLSFSSISYAQQPLHTESGHPQYVTYFDVGVGTYGFDVAATGQPAENWGGSLFVRANPADLEEAPYNDTYFNDIDAIFMGGAEIKYYGLLSEGFFAGPMIAAEIKPAFRPMLGASLGYDYFSQWFGSNFKNMHVGFNIQGGVDTGGNGFVGIGVRLGVGFKNGTRPVGSD